MSNANTHIVLIDNVDSFTYNLVDELRSIGYDLHVYRNTVSAGHIYQKMCGLSGQVVLMLSPGPGEPSQAGCMPAMLQKVQGQFPVLGICLGLQAMVEHYGGVVGRADQVRHGKSSLIEHSGTDVFANLPQPLPVARYHSLMATQVPESLTVLAKYQQVPMAVYHAADKMLGFQFHPESILTAHGSQLIRQSVEFLCEGAA